MTTEQLRRLRLMASSSVVGGDIGAALADIEALTAALQVVLDDVDYSAGACALTEMVGAVLKPETIALARAAIARATGATP